MADIDDPSGPYEPPAKDRPWGVIAAVVAFILLGILAFWVTREKKNDRARREVLATLDKELTDDESALKEQKEKLIQLTQQVEALRGAITSGQKKGKAAKDEFNALAAQQRTEREKFTQMAEAYNKKVAQYQSLEQ